ncbi:MAG: helix-turn-helix domain-containing protein [Pseudomonadota bacterium]
MLNNISKQAFFTPEELAEKLKLSTATVYKLLNQEKLPYFRIGKSYRIPEQALRAYMMREGNLAQFIKITPEIPNAAQRFVEGIEGAPKELRQSIIAVILFGSYARGDYSENSDIDLLVLISQSTKETDQGISAISSEAMAAGGFDEFLSPIRMSLSHWVQLAGNGSPFYEEIQREGIILWPKELKSLKDIEAAQKKS